MAKRFTDSTKWDDGWFTDLDAELKLFWFYVLDKCDHAGVWKVNFKLFEFLLGEKISKEKIIETFKNRFIVLENDKWFIPKFIKFQYGKLNPSNRAHNSVIEILNKYDLLNEHNELKEAPSKPLTSPLLGVKDKDKDKDKDKVKVKPTIIDFEDIYELYPKKEGKDLGLKECKKQIKTRKDYLILCQAIRNYAQKVLNEKIEYTYILKFNNFMKQWRDFVDIQQQVALTTINPTAIKNAISSGIDRLSKVSKEIGLSEIDIDWIRENGGLKSLGKITQYELNQMLKGK